MCKIKRELFTKRDTANQENYCCLCHPHEGCELGVTEMEKIAQKRTEILVGIQQQLRESKPTAPAWEAEFDELDTGMILREDWEKIKAFIRKLINDTKEKT